MALKFLNKKGWHTGSLRNIENVWKAEQKHDAEQKKLEELRKQIQEERERTEFRLLQEKAGLVPKQERLEFLYDSGLSVGRTENSEGFKALEAFPKPDAGDAPSSSASASKQQQTAPGALFEDKPHSANDAWRKLHSDPLLMIRQREQEALAKIKNNPIKMAMIKKSVKGTEPEEKTLDKKERKKHRHSSSKHHKHSSSRHPSDPEDDPSERRKRKTGHGYKQHHKAHSDSEYDSGEEEGRRKRKHNEDRKYIEKSPSRSPRQRGTRDYNKKTDDRYYSKSKSERYASDGQSNGDTFKSGRESEREDRSFIDSSSNRSSQYKRRNAVPKLSEEERAAKLKQMQLAAELHEDQRWKRLKKAEENDAKEVIQSSTSGGRNFLDAAHKSVYGAAEGGSSSIAESVRLRTHYSQGRSEAGEGNAFRR
ncbi:pre-mRNA-splicing factor CWC25 homolog isoform X1 [Neltuma alba]|uniref:pre-mRNA-splicing factor CWC25 homolog isoform X1 n=1 Tax=Neltuma alba TaxID=207710 RepID=UPI0010A2BCC2|nr:pre-mRNA-splicing factor CWC25 homolog isoform X1 [Prosopis alba]